MFKFLVTFPFICSENLNICKNWDLCYSNDGFTRAIIINPLHLAFCRLSAGRAWPLHTPLQLSHSFIIITRLALSQICTQMYSTGLFSLNLNFSPDLRKPEGKYYDQISPVVEDVGWSGAVFPCLMIHYITSNITLGHSHLGPGSPRALSVKLSNNQSARTH